MVQILATKKLSKALKKKFTNANLVLVEKKFIQTKTICFTTPNLKDYLIFTSKKAVKSVLKGRIKNVLIQPCFCVGNKTKSYLEKNGFVVKETTAYAEDLIEIIDRKYKKNSFNFFCGNIRKNTIPNFFQENKIENIETIVYTTEVKKHHLIEEFDGILFFSPSGVAGFLKNNTLGGKICFCIGTTTAKAIANNLDVSEHKNIIIASEPTVENVINEVIKYYKRI
jgi:uroporphyrinogen-III synthase